MTRSIVLRGLEKNVKPFDPFLKDAAIKYGEQFLTYQRKDRKYLAERFYLCVLETILEHLRSEKQRIWVEINRLMKKIDTLYLDYLNEMIDYYSEIIDDVVWGLLYEGDI